MATTLPNPHDYLGYFGLERDPFACGYYRETAELRELQAKLDHLLRHGQCASLIVGDAGLGKSTFLERILTDLDDSFCFVRVAASVLMTDVQMLTAIAQDLGLTIDGSSNRTRLKQYLLRFTRRIAKGGRTLVVSVDDCHLLAGSGLELLLQLASEEWFRLLLVGDRSAAEQPALKARDGLFIARLPRLSGAESRALLVGAFEQAGVATLPFSERQVAAAVRGARGAPGKLRAAAERLMITMVTEHHRGELGVPKRRMALVVGAVTVILAALWSIDYLTEGHVEPAPPAVSALDPEEAIPVPEPLPEVAMQPAGTAGAGQRVAPAGAAPDVVPARPGAEPVPAVGTVAWVMSVPEAHYTIQVLGSGSEAAVKAYVAARIDPGAFGYIRMRRDARDWFVVLTGRFADRSSAVAAAAELVRVEGVGQPWVRTFGSLQRGLQQQHASR